MSSALCKYSLFSEEPLPETKTHPRNMPGGEGLPGVAEEQLAGHVPSLLDGCIGDEAPDGHHEGHTVVCQEGPGPSEPVPPGPGVLDPQRCQDYCRCEEQAPEAILQHHRMRVLWCAAGTGSE